MLTRQNSALLGNALLMGVLILCNAQTLQASDEVHRNETKIPTKVPTETVDLDKDTPESVMQAGKNGVDGLESFLRTLKEVQAVHSRMASNRQHAAKVLEHARKNDRAGLAALFKKDAPSTQVEITEVKDFTVTATYKRADGSTVIVCVSNSSGCSNRRSFVLII